MSHLTDSELVDALDGSLPPGTVTHVRDCAACRDRLAELAQALDAAHQADVPEPSPLFWDHLSTRVREAIAEHPRPARYRWSAWPVLVPLSVLALIVIALLSGVRRDQPQRPRDVASADAVLPRDNDAVEAAWALTANLIGLPDALTAGETDLHVSPGSAEYAAALLTADEQAELVRLLRLELKVGG